MGVEENDLELEMLRANLQSATERIHELEDASSELGGEGIDVFRNWLQYIHKIGGSVTFPDKACNEDTCKAQAAISEIFASTGLALKGASDVPEVPEVQELFHGHAILQYISQENPQAATIPDFDEAIVGFQHRRDTGAVLVYSYARIVEITQKRMGGTRPEALENVDFNVMRMIPYMGRYAPVVVETVQ